MKPHKNQQFKKTEKKGTALLKRSIKEHRTAIKKALKINYQMLFELWADFDDAKTPKKVMQYCDELGSMDAISFMAFCYGYEKAVQRIKELL